MTATCTLARTPLYDWHVAHGGRMVDFAGWSMPVQYGSIVEEHQATRRAVGMFDVSHMGRLEFFGPDAMAFLDQVVTRRVTDMQPGQVRYGLVCNEQGGILDDVLVYRLSSDSTQTDWPSFMMVVNASNREKIVQWLDKQQSGYAVDFKDVTTSTAMIAVQGPKAIELVKPLLDFDITAMRYYRCAFGSLGDEPGWISRTGYTGEDGIEWIGGADAAERVWSKVMSRAKACGGSAAGLGARDTLRLEAAMPLYGHELNEEITPIEAGLDFAVSLKDRDFIGRGALLAAKGNTKQPVRVGLQLEGRRVAREHSRILQGDDDVGYVTSGTFSPTFERPIAMAYVRPSVAAIGTRLAADIRGTAAAATVVPLPFYDRGKTT
ncbi:MAG: glycine cleavage system aminomethyltransferase GcvT [Pirellulales bacterium]